MRWTSLACIAIAIQTVASTALAQGSVEQFYRGKTINIIVGGAAGGGYDDYARALGRHMSKYIPGNPTIVPQNMPGAGGNKAAGYVYSVAPRDGTAIGALFPGSVLAPLLADTPIQHDPAKFIYVGSANSDVYTCVRALRHADQVLQGCIHAGDDRRRQQRGRHHARHAGTVEQRARHEIPHRHRLCRHAGDRARGRAQRDRTGCAATATPACSR